MRYIFLFSILCQTIIFSTTYAAAFGQDFSNPPVWNMPKTYGAVPNISVKKVGLLIPLSGPKKNIGNSILNAAMMALYDNQHSNITLIPIDSGTSEEEAEIAIRKALERSCDLIIGPVFSKQVLGAKKYLPSHVNMISFSNDLTNAGRNIFIAGHSPHEQTNYIIQSLNDYGLTKIIALLPDNKYGKEVGAVFTEIVQYLLDKTPQIYFYDEENIAESFIDQVYDVIVETSPQAIYIPDASRKTISLISKLKYKGLNLSETVIVGSSDWNKPLFLNDHSLKGALFPDTKISAGYAFVEQFKKHFSYKPDVLAEISYDLVSMAAALYQHQPNTCFERKNITSKSGFSGLKGHFHFDKIGRIHRKYTFMEITGGKPKKALEKATEENTIVEKYKDLFEDA
jgi:ABC-type branched-subunit amino acid transport system substrate-binding protein